MKHRLRLEVDVEIESESDHAPALLLEQIGKGVQQAEAAEVDSITVERVHVAKRVYRKPRKSGGDVAPVAKSAKG